jgi:hypothetical protein
MYAVSRVEYVYINMLLCSFASMSRLNSFCHQFDAVVRPGEATSFITVAFIQTLSISLRIFPQYSNRDSTWLLLKEIHSQESISELSLYSLIYYYVVLNTARRMSLFNVDDTENDRRVNQLITHQSWRISDVFILIPWRNRKTNEM